MICYQMTKKLQGSKKWYDRGVEGPENKAAKLEEWEESKKERKEIVQRELSWLDGGTGDVEPPHATLIVYTAFLVREEM